MPTVEVRCENLSMEAKVTVGSRALPTVLNSYRNFFEVSLRYYGWHFALPKQCHVSAFMHNIMRIMIVPINFGKKNAKAS